MCHSVLPLNGSLIGIYIQTQAWTTDYLHPRKQIYRTIYERELIVVIYLLLFALLSWNRQWKGRAREREIWVQRETWVSSLHRKTHKEFLTNQCTVTLIVRSYFQLRLDGLLELTGPILIPISHPTTISHLKPHSGHLSVGSLVMSSLRPATYRVVKQKVLLGGGCLWII